MDVAAAYAGEIADGRLKRDAAQGAVALRLSALAAALGNGKRGGGLISIFTGARNGNTPKGLYIWGAVGRGKTMLMDLFFSHVAAEPKRRVHFHAFMQDVHARLHKVRKVAKDPLGDVARDLAEEARLLCLDEMQIADIADAMIVGRLFQVMLERGTVVVTTSNLPPSELYTDGLNRQLFLPFIALIEEKLDVVSLDSPFDYRLGRVKGHETFITPLGPEADAKMQALWEKLTDTKTGAPMTLPVLGRELKVPEAAHGVARFSFADLCEAPLGAADYLAIARIFSTVFVSGIPEFDARARNPVKRFILLIDTLYDAGTRLVASSARPPDAI
ncbi:MAG: cell division protein ZapE, partial [Parvibaculaceae bacterium]